MNKTWIFTIFVLLAFSFIPIEANCSSVNSITHLSSVSSASYFYKMPSTANFSIIWITDTQYLSENHPTYYDSLCRWIVSNAEKYKVKMVIHTGDVVEDEGNITHWENANRSMSLLIDADIPYCWNAGNHDYNETCWIGNQYTAFDPDFMATKPYWIDDDMDGQNTAVHFGVGDWDFLIINIAYEADDNVLDWANNLLDSYPDSHAIVGAHVYLNTTGGYLGKGRDDSNWPINLKEKVLDTHGNVFLTLSGHHYPASGSRTTVGERHELMFNRQDADGQMGAASLRLMSFDLVNGKIDVQTYVLYANIFLDDSNSQFVLVTDFYNDELAEITEESGSDFSAAVPILLLATVITGIVLTGGYFLLRRR